MKNLFKKTCKKTFNSIFKKIMDLKKRYDVAICKNFETMLASYFDFSQAEIKKITSINSCNSNRKIYDCFIFDSEFELLDLRLNEYYEIVDKFVIVEFSKTHTGFVKNGSNFNKYKPIWEKFSDKIIYKYVDIEEVPNISNKRVNNIENFNRNYIDIVLADYAVNGDIILVSDLDEFWNINVLETAINTNGICFFLQSLFYHYVNNRKNQLWVGSVKYNYGDFLPQEARNMSIKINSRIFEKTMTEIISYANDTCESYFRLICDGGNHYSWLSSIESILQKKDNIYESKDIKGNFTNIIEIKERIENGTDILNRKGWQFKSVILTRDSLASAPKKIDYFISKYPQYFKQIVTTPITKSVELIGLIFASVELLKIMYNEMLKVKNENLDWDIGIKIIANDACDEVLQYLKNSDIPYEIFNNKNPKEYYINRTYRAYNHAAFESKYENIIFIQSDMVFTKNWFKNLVKHHNGLNIPVSRLIEYGNMNTCSWNLISNCGNVFDSPLNFEKLYQLENCISKDGVRYTGLYMPCIFMKKRFVEAGGFPSGNVDIKGRVTTKNKKIYKTGDKWFFENVLRDKYGMNHITVLDSICYHLQEGEKRHNDEKF